MFAVCFCGSSTDDGWNHEPQHKLSKQYSYMYAHMLLWKTETGNCQYCSVIFKKLEAFIGKQLLTVLSSKKKLYCKTIAEVTSAKINDKENEIFDSATKTMSNKFTFNTSTYVVV